MKFGRRVYAPALFLMSAACALASIQGDMGVNVIPAPVSLKAGVGVFVLGPGVSIVHDAGSAGAAATLKQAVRDVTGLDLALKAGGESGGAISLALDPGAAALGPEGYRLTISTEGVKAVAAGPAGLFYAGQTLLQLLPIERVVGLNRADIQWRVPCVEIEDSPRFAWRGLMLDCSRTFQSMEYLKKTVDRMASYKLNVLHLHLTDDQGWRLEIRKYPELTAKGARFPEKYAEPASHHGFYTQAEMKELVRYAAERGITIVPEIEMPGHSLAALACYPRLSCRGGPFELFPFFKGPNITEDVLCAGNEETFAFLTDVLAEVIEIFPSRYIHIGGDEVPKKAWKECPKCQARIQAEGLKNEHELQGYFIGRIEKFVNSKGRSMIGWDEILEGGLAPATSGGAGAAVMSWRGMQGGIAAARAGRNVVMSPTSHCYFDYGYDRIDTRRAYEFEPVPPALDAEQAKRVLGLQANFWSHIDREPENVDRQLFPRLLSIAERGWSPKERRDWTDFRWRVGVQLVRLDEMGVAWKRGALDLRPRGDGTWSPAQMSEEYKPLLWDVTTKVSGPGTYRVLLRYTEGAHRLGVEKVELLAAGEVVAADVHRGVTGVAHERNEYLLELKDHKPGAKYELRASARSEGGTDSNGVVSIEKEPR